MATFGQGVNPQLGAINYAPYQQGAAQGSAAIGQGIRSLGQDLAQGIQQYQQNKLMAGQATSEFEAAAGQSPKLLGVISAPNAPPEVAKAFKKLQKDGAVGLRDAAVLSTYAKTFIMGEQREAQAKMEMQKLQIDAYNAQSRRMQAEAVNAAPAPTAAMRETEEIINNELSTGKLLPDPKAVAGRRAELLSRGGRVDPERFDNAGTFVRREGQQEPTATVKDRNTGQYGFVDQEGKFKPLDPSIWQPITTGDANAFMNESSFSKLAQEVVQEENSVKNLNRYLSGIGDLSTGFQKGIDRFTKTLKTLQNEPLTEKEKALGVNEARQQRLLGALRTTILGPGVLTEIDAQRILNATGGDVASVTANPEIMLSAVKEVLGDKMNAYEQNLDVYNKHVVGRYGQVGYKQRKLVLPNKGEAKKEEIKIPDGWSLKP